MNEWMRFFWSVVIMWIVVRTHLKLDSYSHSSHCHSCRRSNAWAVGNIAINKWIFCSRDCIEYLCIFDSECATSRIDIASMQSLFGPFGRLNAIELNHSLNAILFEDNDSQNFSRGRTDLIDHVLCRVALIQLIKIYLTLQSQHLRMWSGKPG